MTLAIGETLGRDATITALGQAVRAAIGSVVPRGARVALLDFPEYRNVGDSAIWLGQLAALRAAGATVAYTAGISTYNPDELRRNVSPADGIVLLSGGGNFGDLWPRHGEFRARVIDDLPDYHLVQMPQSIHFVDPRNLELTRALLRRHPHLTILVRDGPSRVLAEQGLEHRAVLCPDAAFALGPIPRPCAPEQAIVWLSRHDREGPARGTPVPGGPTPVDWVDEPHVRAPLMNRLARLWHRGGGTVPARLGVRLHQGRAEFRLRHGCRMLARGRVVATNRLHGQILALLMGVPHFVSDTRQGKVGAFYRTWLAEAMPGVMCGSEAEALRRAVQLADAMASEPQVHATC